MDPVYAKLVTMILAILAAASVPAAIGYHGRPKRVWLLLASVELVWFSSIAAIGVNLDGPLRWYRTPVVFAASVLAIFYVAATIMDTRHQQTCEDDADRATASPLPPPPRRYHP
jgi:hypothetical protein